MEVKAYVYIDGALAHYNLSPERSGVYQARLIKYEGISQQPLPEHIIMVKGVRRWVGSCQRQELLNELGAIIEDHMRDRSNASPENRR